MSISATSTAARQPAASSARRTTSEPPVLPWISRIIWPSRSSGASDARHRLLRIAAGRHDDDVRPIDRRRELGRGAFHRGEATRFHIHTATCADLGKPCVVEIVQPQPMPGEAQFGNQIDAADAGADDRDRAHAITPACRSAPRVSRS